MLKLYKLAAQIMRLEKRQSHYLGYYFYIFWTSKMGHISHSKKSLIALIDRLNKYPIGLVDNEILRELLSILFTEQEAYVASKFPLHEATRLELSQATQIPEYQLSPILESMANKGLVTDTPFNGTTYYFLMPGLIGFFEFTMMKNRSDLPIEKVARLMTDYFRADKKKGQLKEFFGSKTQLTRSLIYEDAIPVSSQVTSYESARQIIGNTEYGATTMCHCRHTKYHLGMKCRKGAPIEGTCIALGNGARFLTRRGFAVEKSKHELLQIIDLAQSLKLTHVTDNIRNRHTFICNCCGCCCEIMHGVQQGYYDGIAKTDYIAVIDEKKCDYCGKCFTVCNVKAIKPAKNNDPKRYSEVNEKICLGCGACVSSCPQNAISMVHRLKRHLPKKTKRDLFRSILIEKKRITPFIVDIIKQKIHKKSTTNV